MITLYIVLPCYNEESVLNETAARLKEKFNDLQQANLINDKSRALFVDDGSADKTWNIIKQLYERDEIFAGCKLSRNRGHQNALLAGLHCVADKADAVISMDADLQDDINVIDEFIKQYNQGFDVVYGVRSKRDKDTVFKRATAQGYYKFMRKMGVDIVYNHADCRLISNRALKALLEFKEVNLFLRGLVPLVGFKSTKIYYERNKRFAGESKYPLSKMIKFALEGITSFSIKPIRFVTFLGCFCFFISIIMLIYSLISFFTNNTVVGWASIITSIWALGGLQLLAIGIIGEYIAKVYMETKNRPRFIIEEFLNR